MSKKKKKKKKNKIIKNDTTDHMTNNDTELSQPNIHIKKKDERWVWSCSHHCIGWRSVSEVSSSDSGENTSTISTSVPSPMYNGKVKRSFMD